MPQTLDEALELLAAREADVADLAEQVEAFKRFRPDLYKLHAEARRVSRELQEMADRLRSLSPAE